MSSLWWATKCKIENHVWMNLASQMMMTWTICIARIYLEKLDIPSFSSQPLLKTTINCVLSALYKSVISLQRLEDIWGYCSLKPSLTSSSTHQASMSHKISKKKKCRLEWKVANDQKMCCCVLFCFFLNTAANTSKLTTTDLSKSCFVFLF